MSLRLTWMRLGLKSRLVTSDERIADRRQMQIPCAVMAIDGTTSHIWITYQWSARGGGFAGR